MPARKAAVDKPPGKRVRPAGTCSMMPSLDTTALVILPPDAVRPLVVERGAEEKHYRETLAGDVKRAVNRGSSANVEMWSPDIAYALPKNTQAITFPEYEEAGMRARADAPPCRLGRLCQGRTLSSLLPHPCGTFVLPLFTAHTGATFSGLCILCLRLAWTRDVIEGRPWQPMKDMQPFAVSKLRYGEHGDVCIKYV